VVDLIGKHIRAIVVVLVLVSCVLVGARLKIGGGLPGGDSVLYYSYLRSMIIDRDLDFENEFEYFHSVRSGFTGNRKLPEIPDRDTRTGRFPMLYTYGTMITWAPFFAIGHLFAVAYGYLSDQPSYYSGYSMIDYTFTSLSAVFCVFFVFIFLARFLIKHLSYEASTSYLACLTVGFSTSIAYYTLFAPTTSHLPSLFWVVLFCVIFLDGHLEQNLSLRKWIVLGLVFGLAVVTRAQNLVLILLPGTMLVYELLRERRLIFPLSNLFVFGFVSFVTMIPQLLINKYLHGGYLLSGYDSVGAGFEYWFNPKVLYVLFSPEKGLFIWTPITLIATIGIFFLESKVLRNMMIIFAVAQLYLVSAWSFYWQGYDSFSIRMLTNCGMVFVLGLLPVMARLRSSSDLRAILFALFFSLVNGVMMVLYAFRIIGTRYGA